MIKEKLGLLFVSISIFLVSLNLRPIIAVIGPIFNYLQEETKLSSLELGMLSTLPVIMMGIASLLGGYLMKYIDEVKGIIVGLILIMATSIVRYYDQSPHFLIFSAILGGAGIGLIQSIAPSYIKRYFPNNASTLMSFFTTGIMAGAAAMAAIASPLLNRFGLSITLGFAVFPAIVGFLSWFFSTRNEDYRTASKNSYVPLPLKKWYLMIFFGIGTGAYTLVLAWLPPYYIENGWSADQSGYILGLLTINEVISGFIISSIIHKINDKRVLVLIVLTMILCGLLYFIFFGAQSAVIPIVLLGLGIGALFPLSLIVTIEHTKSPKQAGSLLSFVQGGGYLIAASMPAIAGSIRDSFSSLQYAWVVMVVGVIFLMLMTIKLRSTE